MSGIYFVHKNEGHDLHETARLVSSQLSYGEEAINHYGISGDTVMGMVSPDRYSKGVMPRYFKDEEIWGLFSGILYECDYNRRLYREFSRVKDDLDLIKALYMKQRLENCLPQMNGAFFFILWDKKNATLVAGNDRYGLYPMYWSNGSRGFCLASRVLASVLADIVSGEWNLDGVMQLLTIDDLLDDTTLVSGVHAFPQASILYMKRFNLKWRSYWQYDYSIKSAGMNKVELAEELGNRFMKGVKLQALGGRRLGVTLSGGLDSRLIVAAARSAGIHLHTFTWGKSDSYDRGFARDVSKKFNTVHHEYDYAFKNLESRYEAGIRATEGHMNYFDCHMLAYLEVMREHADVILNGYAGDLVLGGSYLRNTWMLNIPLDRLAQIIFSWHNSSIREDKLEWAIPNFLDIDKERRPSMFYKRLMTNMKGIEVPNIVDRFFLENRIRRQCSMGTVLMRYVVESTAPFFDYDLIDLITSIPPDLRYEHKIYLLMMERKFRQALDIRWQRTLLPASAPKWLNVSAKAILKGCRILETKTGWQGIASRQSPVDFATWLRGPLSEWMRSVFYEYNPFCDRILKPEFCREIYQRHLDGEDMTRLIGAVLSIRGLALALERAKSKTVPYVKSPNEISRD